MDANVARAVAKYSSRPYNQFLLSFSIPFKFLIFIMVLAMRTKMSFLLFSSYIFLTFAGLAQCLNAAGWRSQSIYQVLTDRFARTDGSTTAACDLSEYCGGTWQGIISQLDYIQDMGFTAVSVDELGLIRPVLRPRFRYGSVLSYRIYRFPAQTQMARLITAIGHRISIKSTPTSARLLILWRFPTLYTPEEW